MSSRDDDEDVDDDLVDDDKTLVMSALRHGPGSSEHQRVADHFDLPLLTLDRWHTSIVSLLLPHALCCGGNSGPATSDVFCCSDFTIPLH